MSKILVVDDDPMCLEVLAIGLRSLGHEPYTFENPVEAIKSFQVSTGFDIIITDVMMPELDGIELIKRVRVIDSNVKILVISGGGRMNGVDLSELSLSAGATAYLAKPFGIHELSELL